MTTAFIARILFFTLLIIVALIISRLTRIDRRLCCVAVGLVGGALLPAISFDTGIRASNIRDIVFYTVLPILIFAAAWEINPKLLRRWLLPILVLATVGVLITGGIISLLTYVGINHPAGFPLTAALLTGTILAATDPSSVIATLQQRQADKNLAILLEGESLFNDATAIVIFTLVLQFALGVHSVSISSSLSIFAVTFLGGLLLGFAAGLIATILVLTINETIAAVIILLTLALSSYFVAEHTLHVSGIMAVMAAAITSKLLLHEHREPLLSHIEATWQWLSDYLSLWIFVLLGLVTTRAMFIDQWLAMIIAIAAAVFARSMAVFFCCLPFRYGTRPIPARWSWIMSLGGMRGVVAIALVLSLPIELPYWWTIQSMVFGVVYFSLLVQSTTVGLLVNKPDN